MEEQHYLARAKLRDLQREHPEWTHDQMAEAVGYSKRWARKWRQRLREAPPDDDTVLWGQSRARKTVQSKCTPPVVERILDIRDNPPENLKRTPGPLAILYYLHKDEALKAAGEDLPRSTRTIWRVLDQYQRIIRFTPAPPAPWERLAPLTGWAIDFKDVATVPADPAGKQQHVVETLNVVDEGTSILLDAHVRADFNEETALYAVAETLLGYGLPDQVRFDRDTRFVGSAGSRDFPSPFMRFLLSLGIATIVCPPRRPDLNPFVERYNGTYERECLQVHRPADLAQTCEVTAAFGAHYNHERPHQAITCGNQPPRVAFSDLPALPSVPEVVNPDAWLESVHGHRYPRRVRADGTVTVDNQRYYIKQKLAGQRVVLVVHAFRQEFLVLHHKQVKQVPIKGLYHGELPFQDYLRMIGQEAISQRRRYGRRKVASTSRPL